MSLSTCPAATFANNRKPREKERNPSEIISRRIEGISKTTVETSMQNIKFVDNLKKEQNTNSRILQINVENKIVEKTSTTMTADVHDKLKLNAKNKKIAIHKNKEFKTRGNKS